MRSSEQLAIPGARPDEPYLDELAKAASERSKAEHEAALQQARQLVADASAPVVDSTAHSDSITQTGGEEMHTNEPVAPQVPQPEPLTPMVASPRPEAYIKDATVNGVLDLGSFAAKNASDIVDFATWLVREAGYALNPINMSLMATQVSRLVRRVSFRYTGTANLQMGAATRSLFAVKAAIKYAAPPFGQSADLWAFWSNRVEKIALAVMTTSDEVYLDASLELDLDASLEAAFQPLPTEPFNA